MLLILISFVVSVLVSFQSILCLYMWIFLFFMVRIKPIISFNRLGTWGMRFLISKHRYWLFFGHFRVFGMPISFLGWLSFLFEFILTVFRIMIFREYGIDMLLRFYDLFFIMKLKLFFYYGVTKRSIVGPFIVLFSWWFVALIFLSWFLFFDWVYFSVIF